MNNRAHRRDGFTLVELLVVIAIISILAGMLLPALQRARDSAVSVNCLSNHKQFLLAEQMYADEYEGIMPVTIAYAQGSENPNDYWEPFYNLLSNAGSLTGRLSTGRPGYLEVKVLVCPANTLSPEDWNHEYADKWERNYRTYGMYNASAGGNTAVEIGLDPLTAANPRDINSVGRYVGGNGGPNRYFIPSRARKPGKSQITGDTNHSTRHKVQGNGGAYLFQYRESWSVDGGGNMGLHLRHRERANAGFIDGHADSLGIRDMLIPADKTVSYTAINKYFTQSMKTP